MSVAEFYNEAKHLGNLFGARGPLYGRNGHLGVDFKKHPAGTPIPSWTAGVVVYNGWSRNLGWIVIVRRVDGLFAGFCHMQEQSPLSVGDLIEVDDIVGKVGSTGRFSTGPHLHATLEPTIDIGTANAIDPLPYIRAAVAASKPKTRKVSPVTAFYCTQSDKPSTEQSPQKIQAWAIGGDSPGTSANWYETTNAAEAAALGHQHNASGNQWVWLTKAKFAATKASYLEPVRTAGASLPEEITGTFVAKL